MRQLALAKKLLWLTVGSIFITVFVLSSVLWWQLSSSNQQLAAQSEKLIVAEVEDKLASNAAAYGEQVAGFTNGAVSPQVIHRLQRQLYTEFNHCI